MAGSGASLPAAIRFFFLAAVCHGDWILKILWPEDLVLGVFYAHVRFNFGSRSSLQPATRDGNVIKHRCFAGISLASYSINSVGLVSVTVTLVPRPKEFPDANEVPFCSKIRVGIPVFEPS